MNFDNIIEGIEELMNKDEENREKQSEILDGLGEFYPHKNSQLLQNKSRYVLDTLELQI